MPRTRAQRSASARVAALHAAQTRNLCQRRACDAGSPTCPIARQVALGRGMVVEVDCGYCRVYSAWEPCHIHTSGDPTNDRLARGYYRWFQDATSRQDVPHQRVGDHSFWPGGRHGHPLADHDAIAKLWETTELARAYTWMEMALPELREVAFGVRRGGLIVRFTATLLDAHDLDDLITSKADLGPYLGWKVSHDMLGTGRLVRLRNGEPAVAVRLTCAREGCGNRVRGYVTSGVHRGAFCYLVDRDGTHLGDLRWEQPVCGRHASGRRRRS